MVGSRLGPYRVLEKIGEGGMGEVYRARDDRLGRDVAIKVSAARFSDRFEREARAIASLNHPNICTLHDVGPNYLVMELVDGKSPRGPLPLEMVIAHARQIAAALEAAHEKGIVHRDLKPANIKVTSNAIVKVLDFGLAKVEDAASSRDPADSPTMTSPARLGHGHAEAGTAMGMILGTAAYMAPEQAAGKSIDKRADIWAFGVVVYEMLTGRLPFRGESIQEILAAVLRDEPDLRGVPLALQPLLRRCLEKDAAKRLRDIGDAMPLVDELSRLTPAASAPVRRAWFWPAVAATFGLATMLAVWAPWRTLPLPRVTRLQVSPPAGHPFGAFTEFSPNGRSLLFTAQGPDGRVRLWVRDLEALTPRQLVGPEITGEFRFGFWSPDSRFIAFADGNTLRKIDASGVTPPVTLTTVPMQVGPGNWGANGVILFGGVFDQSPIWRVPETGGEAVRVTTAPAGGVTHQLPTLLPDGRHFLWCECSAERAIYRVGSLDVPPSAQPTAILAQSSSQLTYVPATDSPDRGYLVFVRDGSLLAQPFDPGALKTTGDAVTIAGPVGTTSRPTGWAFFGVSREGTVVYRRAAERQFAWVDRSGRLLTHVGERSSPGPVRIAPDGTRAAIERAGDVWVIDFARGVETRFTLEATEDSLPLWSADGRDILFKSKRAGKFGVYQRPADGAASERLVYESVNEFWLDDWSHDGQFVSYNAYADNGNEDEWLIKVGSNAPPVRLLQSSFKEYWAQFSPDDRWIAYQSDETGRFEVYLRAFSSAGPAVGPPYQVSRGGGQRPLWRKDGRELVYVAANATLTAVPVLSGATPRTDPPISLFRMPSNYISYREFAFAPDGQRLLMPMPVDGLSSDVLTVVSNWESALKR